MKISLNQLNKDSPWNVQQSSLTTALTERCGLTPGSVGVHAAGLGSVLFIFQPLHGVRVCGTPFQSATKEK